MKKKNIIIIFLLMVMCVFPASSQQIEKASCEKTSDVWLYVGGSGPGNYSTIQDAVDNASSGDTVFVYHGLYQQLSSSSTCVKIFKSITLIGEDKNTTIINGIQKWDILRILASDIHISGFTVKNAGRGTYPGAGIHIYDSDGIHKLKNITVHDVILSNNELAMTLYDCLNATCYDNLFTQNGLGCSIIDSANCTITQNYFLNNSKGLELYQESSIEVSSNVFQDNAIGINCGTCKGVNISCNNFINNTKQATFLKEGGLNHLLRFIRTYKQHWDANYWSDWNKQDPRPIRGILLISIGGPIIGFPLYLPSVEYDKNPVQEPYPIDISS